MAFDITEAVGRIQELWLEVPGVRAAPDYPPEKLDPFPIAVTFERFGELDNAQMYSGSFAPTRGTIWSDLHIQRTSLPLSIKAAMSFRDAFLRKLMGDPDLADFVMVVRTVRWTLQPLEWNGIPTTGYRFELDFVTEMQPS